MVLRPNLVNSSSSEAQMMRRSASGSEPGLQRRKKYSVRIGIEFATLCFIFLCTFHEMVYPSSQVGIPWAIASWVVFWKWSKHRTFESYWARVSWSFVTIFGMEDSSRIMQGRLQDGQSTLAVEVGTIAQLGTAAGFVNKNKQRVSEWSWKYFDLK